jgi:hypothetical protein
MTLAAVGENFREKNTVRNMKEQGNMEPVVGVSPGAERGPLLLVSVVERQCRGGEVVGQ